MRSCPRAAARAWVSRALVAGTAVTLVAVGALAGTPVAPAVGAVATQQSYWVPVDQQVVVQGHGFGHGHGMSQYGAEGAALAGKTYTDILDFYYPGTSWSKVRGNVRVLISGDSTSDVVVSPAAGLTVTDLGDHTTYPLPDKPGVTRWRLAVAADGGSVVAFKTRRWHRFRPDGKNELAGDGQFAADGPLTLWTPSGPRDYRGALRAASPTPGATYRDTVNVLSMDDYVKGVVPSEMPPSWDPEAVKAQAVAARTYATWSRNQYRHRYYQICDTSACQVYGGVGAEDPRSNAAVDATSRQILTYDGKPAFTQFSSSDGGWTADGGQPYLPAQQDPYDGWSGNPVHDWTVTLDAGRLQSAYPSIGRLRRLLVVQRDGNGDWQGRVDSMVLDGTRGDVTITGDAFQWAFGLRSDWFSIEPTPIISRWSRIGGDSSKLGPVKGPEYQVDNGSAQAFQRGRIFYSTTTGAHELYGPILRKYRRMRGPSSVLGLPTSTIRSRGAGIRASFQHGVIFSRSDLGTVALSGPIAAAYLAAGGIKKSGLGWPTQDNFDTQDGQRANFEHGYITWSQSTDTTQLAVSQP